VIDPAALLDEIDMLEKAGIDFAGQLRISNRAHVIFPFHRMVEKMSEARKDRVAIGTTSRGIGPCYEDKIGRRGIRMADLLDREIFRSLLHGACRRQEDDRRRLRHPGELDFAAMRDSTKVSPNASARWSAIPSLLLAKAMRAASACCSKAPRARCSTSTTAPTRSSPRRAPAAGGACTGAGVAPTRIDGVIGVSKAYITRVGGGPFPTEDHTEVGDQIRKAGKEFGAVTGRPRRCGWFDVPLLRYTAAVNGFDSLVITKMDVLDELAEIPMPAANAMVERIEAVYETLPGWQTVTRGTTRIEDLPAAARTYLDFLAARTGVEVGCVSVGPERNETIIVPGSKLEKLLG
jgi:adenylosuccinate synthase